MFSLCSYTVLSGEEEKRKVHKRDVEDVTFIRRKIPGEFELKKTMP